MNYIFVDLEMNPVAANLAKKNIYRTETIEIGAVKLNDSFQEIDTFSSYVKPVHNRVTKQISKLTSITNKTLEQAPYFCEAMTSFFDWCGEDACIYSWSMSDKLQILHEAESKQFTHPYLIPLLETWVDFQKMFGDKLETNRSIRLKEAVQSIGNDFEGHAHSALADAINTARLFELTQNEALFYQRTEYLRNAKEAAEPLTNSLGDLMKNKLAGFHFD